MTGGRQKSGKAKKRKGGKARLIFVTNEAGGAESLERMSGKWYICME